MKETEYDVYVDRDTFTFNPLGMARVKLLIDINDDQELDQRDRFLSPKKGLLLYRPYGLGYYYCHDEGLDMHCIVLKPDKTADNFVHTGIYLQEDEFEFLEDAVVPGRLIIVTACGDDNVSFPGLGTDKPAIVVGINGGDRGYVDHRGVDLQFLKEGNDPLRFKNTWCSNIEHVKLID